ncbi:MAG: hypothetical protein E6K53_00030 [Gammaproteobacteria bacterium]|nr:MAG: hypothetical protein E6K53_00030 [Gammaproteobacteria bacterium]
MLADADSLPPVPSRYQDGMVAIHDYLHLRQEGWAMLMSALRTEHGKDFSDKKFAAEEKLRWLNDRLVVARNEGLLPPRY